MKPLTLAAIAVLVWLAYGATALPSLALFWLVPVTVVALVAVVYHATRGVAHV